jgi:hypothetical protein
MADHACEPARARASRCEGGVGGVLAGRSSGLGRMLDVVTLCTSWTTSHNASRGPRQTLLVDVDYGRKATSHKRLKQSP